ncbi:MAG TPA: di-heme enzyme [Gemmatimonadaceae bacterium]|nr:di-heme enzyme [Gemmatimonadaceae bacterium]
MARLTRGGASIEFTLRRRASRHALRFAASSATVASLFCSACGTDRATGPSIPSGDAAAFTWQLPDGFPRPLVPADNPMSDAKVELGRRLFYDTRLSGNGAFSCSSCHRQSNAFADARNLPFGSTGQPHPRNSMSLPNVGYQVVLGWANTESRSLETQALIPMLGEHPVELGLAGREPEMLNRLRTVALYTSLFRAAFPGDASPVTLGNVTKAIGSFERTLVSGDSPYDRYKRGLADAISPAAKRGETLFTSDRLKCSQCHSGIMLTNAARWAGSPTADPEFFNTGLYNIDGTGAYPAANTGLEGITRVAADMGKFKVPSLRNIDVTFPYMHDGTVATLSDVIDHYAAGGRTLAGGANGGIGSANPFKSALIAGFTITAAEKDDLIAFLRSLTDSTFLTNPRLSNPWIVR